MTAAMLATAACLATGGWAADPVTRVWTTLADFSGGEGYAAGATLWEMSTTDGYLTLARQQEYAPDPTSTYPGNPIGSWWSRDPSEAMNWRVMRLDPAGANVFSADYNSPGSADDAAQGVALLPGGGFIAAGWEYRQELGQSWNMRIRRYDDLGALVAEESYDSPASAEDRALGVAVDPVTGAYAVVGFENRAADLFQSFNAHFRHYGPGGTPVTVSSWNGVDNLADEYRSVTFNTVSGGWAAAGYTTRNGEGTNWLLSRYNAAGTLLWSTEYSGADNADEMALAVAASPVTGNLVIAGWQSRTASGQGRDWLIRTYSAAGSFVSEIGCDAPASPQDDGAIAAVVDLGTNSWVAGWETRDDLAEGENMLLRRYDATGLLDFSVAHTGPVADGDDRATAVAATNAGAAVMGGYEYGGPGIGNRWRVVQYKPRGASDPPLPLFIPHWSTAFDGPVPGGDDRVAAVAAAPSASVFIAGWMDFGAPFGQDWVVKLMNFAGTSVLWTRTLDGMPGGASGGGEDRALGIAMIKPSSSAYVVGYATDTAGGTGKNWVIRKFGITGTVMLEVSFDGLASGDDIAYGVGTDANGNIYVAGEADMGGGSLDWVVLMMDSAGALLSPPIVYDSGAGQDDSARAITVLPNGHFAVAGIENRTDLGEGENWRVRFHDPTGTLLWSRTYNAPPNLGDQALGISMSSIGAGSGPVRMLAAGTADRSDAGAGLDLRLEWSTTTGGNLQVLAYASASCFRDETATAVAVDASGNIIAGGWEDRTDLGQGRNWTLRKYTAAGALLWRVGYDGDLGWDDEITSVAVDGAGNVYAGGFAQFAGALGDFVVRKYDPGGALLWSRRYDSVPGMLNVEAVRGMAVDAAGNVTVAGEETRSDLSQLTMLPMGLVDHAAVRVGDLIYVIGGTEQVANSSCATSGTPRCVPFVRFARIEPSGRVGAWTRAHYAFGDTGPAQYPFGPPVTPQPGVAISNHKAVAVGNRIYVVGGRTSCPDATPPFEDLLDDVWSTVVDPVTGQTGPWVEEIPLLQAGRNVGLVHAAGSLFAFGGAIENSGRPTTAVQRAEIAPDGRLYSSNQKTWDGSILALTKGTPACSGGNLCNACTPQACSPCTNACVIAANECLGWTHLTAFTMMRTIAFLGAGYRHTMDSTPCSAFDGAVWGWLGDDNKPVSWQIGMGSVSAFGAQPYSTPVIGNGTLLSVGGYAGTSTVRQALYPPLGVAKGMFRTGSADGAELRPALPKSNEMFPGQADPYQLPVSVKGSPGIVLGDYAYLVGGELGGSSPCRHIYRTRLASTTWWVDAGSWLSPPQDLGTTTRLMRVSWSMSKSGAGITDDWVSFRYRVAGADGVWSVWSPRIPEENAMPAAPGYYTYASDVPGNQPFFRMPVAPGIVRYVQFEVSLYNDNGGLSDGGPAPTLPRFDEFRLTYIPVPPDPPLKPGCPLEAYPNPAKDRLTVRFEVAPEGGEVRMRIVNAAAQLVAEENFSYVAGGVVSETVDLGGWAPGAYVILLDGVSRGGESALYCTGTDERFKRLKEKFVIRR